MKDWLPYYWTAMGALILIGGIIGFIKAGSRASLIAGVICCVLLDGAFAACLMGRPSLGHSIGLGVSVLLLIRFRRSYLQNPKPMPALPVIGLSLIGIVAGISVLLG